MNATPPLACGPAAAASLAEVLALHAAQRPEAVALVFEGQALAYGALHRRVLRLAARLRHVHGLRQGDRVAWLGYNHADQLVLLWALARLGAMLVPLNFRLAPAEWAAVLADCTPVTVVHDAAWADAAHTLAGAQGLPAWAVKALCDGGEDGHGHDHGHGGRAAPDPTTLHALGAERLETAADMPVLLVYTSGTTGAPKGAVHTQGNLLANMRMAQQVQRLTPADTVATVLPLFHVGGLCIQTLPALYAGARVLLHPRFDPTATLACIASDRPSLTLLVPATMKALIEHAHWARTDLASLRAVWAGSSTLPQPLVDAFQARGVPVCNVYGATETGPFSVALDEAHPASHPGSCGWPAPGVELRLADARDGVGELWLRAPNIVRHYWPRKLPCQADS